MIVIYLGVTCQSLTSSMLGPCGYCESFPQNFIEKHMCKVGHPYVKELGIKKSSLLNVIQINYYIQNLHYSLWLYQSNMHTRRS